MGVLYAWVNKCAARDVFHLAAGPGHKCACGIQPWGFAMPGGWRTGPTPPAGRELCHNCARMQNVYPEQGAVPSGQ